MAHDIHFITCSQAALLGGLSDVQVWRNAKAGKYGELAVRPGSTATQISLSGFEKHHDRIFTDEQLAAAVSAKPARGKDQKAEEQRLKRRADAGAACALLYHQSGYDAGSVLPLFCDVAQIIGGKKGHPRPAMVSLLNRLLKMPRPVVSISLLIMELAAQDDVPLSENTPHASPVDPPISPSPELVGVREELRKLYEAVSVALSAVDDELAVANGRINSLEHRQSEDRRIGNLKIRSHQEGQRHWCAAVQSRLDALETKR